MSRALWARYLDKHWQSDGEKPSVEMLNAGQTAELLWSFNALFAKQTKTLQQIASLARFDNELNAQLLQVAEAGDTGSFTTMSAGAWRRLLDRLTTLHMLLALEDHGGGDFSIPVPLRAPEEVRRLAVFLALAGASDIPNLPPDDVEQSLSPEARIRLNLPLIGH